MKGSTSYDGVGGAALKKLVLLFSTNAILLPHLLRMLGNKGHVLRYAESRKN